MHNKLKPPVIFSQFAVICVIGAVLSIVASIYFPPPSKPMFHFNEGGAIAVLSSVTLSMAGVLSLLIFYFHIAKWKNEIEKWDNATFFWLILSAGCVFLALDEHLQFHERGGQLMETTSLGEPEMFRNWNDFIVIVYGVIALAIAAVFGREIMKCRMFALMFVIGFAFYAIHTGIDSIMPSAIEWKDIPEESAKLLSVLFIFLATCAQLLAMLDPLLKSEPRA